MSFQRISILGLGLLGGSVALAARSHLSDCKIKAYDPNRDSLEQALVGGAVDAIADTLSDACDGAECVIVCVPLAQVVHVLTTIAPHLPPGVCVTDVSSTKQAIVAAAHRLLPKMVHFVGSHPMAGRELSGFAAARADLFDGALCLTTPVPETDPDALSRVEAFWQSLGSRIQRLSPQDHDRRVAEISHLPHAIASALVSSISDETMAIAGPGFRDVTRIAAADASLWRDILINNAPEVRRSLTDFRAELDQLDSMLQSGDAVAVEKWLQSAAIRRRTLGTTASSIDCR